METCTACGKRLSPMKALGSWPRCQHNFEDRTFDPNSQCVWKSGHRGCHKAEYPYQGDNWSCAK